MIVLISLLASSLAFATEPDSLTLPLPTSGAVIVSVNGEVTGAIRTSARKGGDLALKLAEAEAIRRESEERAEEHDLRLQMQLVRGPAEAELIKDAGMAMVIGKNVRVRTPEGLEVDGGEHLNWRAYGAAVASAADSRMYAPQMGYYGGGDPNLFRLSGGQMGAFYGPTPVTPGQMATDPAAATADCGTAARCQETITALQGVMEASDE